jgi:hypothetical protein
VDRDAGVQAFIAAKRPMADGWSDMFSQAFARTAESTDKAMNFCQKAEVITKEQIQQSMNNRSQQIKLMAKAVAWYLNQK